MNRQLNEAAQAAHVSRARDQLHQARRKMLAALAHICGTAASHPLPTDVAPLAAHILELTTQVTAAIAPAEDVAAVLAQTNPRDVPLPGAHGRAVGLCWRCERDTAVEWVGPVPARQKAPMYLCEPCQRRLSVLAHGAMRNRDTAHL